MEIEKVQGFWWPKRIKPTCYANSFHYAAHADVGMSYARRGSTCIQAGGNIGLWPLKYAGFFRYVHTFEPEPTLHECLERNTANARQIIKVHGVALGEHYNRCEIRKRSLAAHRVTNIHREATTPIMPIDSYHIQNVGLIQLDIEGYELAALRGAARTIDTYRPVIQVELGGLGVKNGYGFKDKDVRKFLADYGYREVARISHDVIFAHA